jgi:hypothetical protein
MFLKRRLFALLLSLDSRQISRENIMVLNGAMEHEELTLMPVDGFDAVYEPNAKPLPVFIFGDDDDLDDEDDFEEDEDDFEEDEDDYDNEEDELDEDEDDDYDDDDDDEDFDEDDEDWDEDEE